MTLLRGVELLTDHQRRVLAWAARGYRVRAIGRHTGRTDRFTEWMLDVICRVLDVETIDDAVRIYQEETMQPTIWTFDGQRYRYYQLDDAPRDAHVVYTGKPHSTRIAVCNSREAALAAAQAHARSQQCHE